MKKKLRATIALYLVAVLPVNAGEVEEAIPRYIVEWGRQYACTEPSPWPKKDWREQQSCLRLDVGYALHRKLSVRVQTGLQLSGLGVRYRYNEVAFTELQLNRRGDFISIFYSLKY